ncbi:MAG: hypothetical protein ACI9V1_001126 [Spirosomataceae bacterium]|jgi:hypothetical protein
MANHKNIVRLQVIAKALEEVVEKVIFVGGAVVELYCDDPAKEESRPTDDIDVVVELISYSKFAYLEDKLRAAGFANETNSGVICRYVYHDIIVDIMPTSGEVLGFTNKWYEVGAKNTTPLTLSNGQNITLFQLLYFIGSKFEALKSKRHGSDYRLNSDFEDIIYLFNNRTTIENDITSAESNIKDYIIEQIILLCKRPFITDEISANLDFSNRENRKNRILNIWERLSEIKGQ